MATTYTTRTTTRRTATSYDRSSTGSPMLSEHSGHGSSHLTLPPKVELLRTPSPKDKIEEPSDMKYHSHHLDYKYTPPPVKGPCVACGMYIVGSLVTACDEMWHPECFTCVNCDTILKAYNYQVQDNKQYCKPCHEKLFGPPCSACHKPTKGNRLIVLNRIWHPNCFCCVECGKILTTDNFIERLGSPYCKEDYHRLFSPKCCVCTEPIKDKAINALGKMWHTYCFKCTACGIPLEERNFYEKNGKPYCEKDYMNLFHPKCTGCSLPIAEGRQITAMGKPWHPECFVCTICVKPLTAETFKEQGGKPYCEEDFHKLFSPKCGGCQQPIKDNNKITAMGKPWHPQCFTCDKCVRPLDPNNYYEKNGKPYCEDDYHKLFSPKCQGCLQPIKDENQIKAMGAPWHPQCFQCTQCAKPLSPNNYYEKNGSPYCEDDFHKLFSPKCAGCQLPIKDGNFINAMGKPWHPQCFQCTQCAKPLSPNNFFEKNGKPYCENDFHKLFSPKCSGCHTPINDGNQTNAMGKPWHPQCFQCDKCAKPLSPNNFYEMNGKPYCEDDYHKLFSPKCDGCALPIKDGNYINALGKTWHPQCFQCTECAIPLSPKNFYEKNGKPYCKDDYHKLFSPKCFGCHQPIVDGNYIKAQGKDWHPQCFKCTTCEVPLDPNNFLEKAGKPYCEKDYHKLFSPPCDGCGYPIKDQKSMVKELGKNWHPECFRCHKCHKVLSPNNYMEKSGKPYCVEDYHNLFSPKCSECNLPIEGKPLIALGRQWHPNCFKCCQCAVPLSPNNFKEKDGKPYCLKHFQELYLPKCYGCKRPITDKIINALGKQWHPECFACVQCHKPLAEDGYREKDGLPYCDFDYHALFSPKCAACHAPIREKCLTAMAKTWHPEHFLCQHCNKQLSDDPEGYHEHNDKSYCRPCYIELFAPYCRACNKPIVDKICVTALDAKWHPDCFVCRDCHCPLKTGNYFEFEGEPYCEEHFRCKMCPDCVKLRRAQNKYFGQNQESNGLIRLGA
ncbi:zinc finger protein 808-like isoform X3 [Oppia nitens]|uniref:zinc finger protein 808-like isoform X3 n=1 Tax=Oppia nitens TaxID=1686743 RepID=UPI0023D99CC2|nr:zinc finger protein 808-like isoform X3 [Oppia nitens]